MIRIAKTEKRLGGRLELNRKYRLTESGCSIYMIEFQNNGEWFYYIGRTGTLLENRFSSHLRTALAGNSTLLLYSKLNADATNITCTLVDSGINDRDSYIEEASYILDVIKSHPNLNLLNKTHNPQYATYSGNRRQMIA